MSELSEIRRQLFAISLELGAIQLDMACSFCWASGYMMPIYNDSRLLLFRPKARKLIAGGLERLLGGQKVDHIVGVATGGIACAVVLAESLELPMQYIRSRAKAHGLSRQVEGLPGNSYNGSSVVVIEDVISTGESSLQAIKAVRQAGAEVLGCFAVYSYAFPQAEQAFARAGVSYQAILSFPQLLEYLVRYNLFTEREIEQLQQWHRNPFSHPAT